MDGQGPATDAAPHWWLGRSLHDAPAPVDFEAHMAAHIVVARARLRPLRAEPRMSSESAMLAAAGRCDVVELVCYAWSAAGGTFAVLPSVFLHRRSAHATVSPEHRSSASGSTSAHASPSSPLSLRCPGPACPRDPLHGPLGGGRPLAGPPFIPVDTAETRGMEPDGGTAADAGSVQQAKEAAQGEGTRGAAGGEEQRVAPEEEGGGGQLGQQGGGACLVNMYGVVPVYFQVQGAGGAAIR